MSTDDDTFFEGSFSIPLKNTPVDGDTIKVTFTDGLYLLRKEVVFKEDCVEEPGITNSTKKIEIVLFDLGPFFEEYSYLFEAGTVFNKKSSQFTLLMATLREKVPFPFPVITGAAVNSTVEISLSMKNKIAENDYELPFTVRDILMEGYLELFIAETEENERIQGVPYLDMRSFVATNWPDNEDKQESIIDKIDEVEKKEAAKIKKRGLAQQEADV